MSMMSLAKPRFSAKGKERVQSRVPAEKCPTFKPSHFPIDTMSHISRKRRAVGTDRVGVWSPLIIEARTR